MQPKLCQIVADGPSRENDDLLTQLGTTMSVRGIKTAVGSSYDEIQEKNAYLYRDKDENVTTHSILPDKCRVSFSYGTLTAGTSTGNSMPTITSASHTLDITSNSPTEIDLGTVTLEAVTP